MRLQSEAYFEINCRPPSYSCLCNPARGSHVLPVEYVKSVKNVAGHEGTALAPVHMAVGQYEVRRGYGIQGSMSRIAWPFQLIG